MLQRTSNRIAARHADAVAPVYDHYVERVTQFCAAVCPEQRVEEVVEAAMINFFSRATKTPGGVVPATMPRNAVREVAAGRVRPEAVRESHLTVPPRQPVGIRARPGGLARLVRESARSRAARQERGDSDLAERF